MGSNNPPAASEKIEVKLGGSLGQLPLHQNATVQSATSEKDGSSQDKAFKARMSLLQKSFKTVRRGSVSTGDILQTLQSTSLPSNGSASPPQASRQAEQKRDRRRTPPALGEGSEGGVSFRGAEKMADRGPSSLSKQCRRLSMHILSQENPEESSATLIEAPPEPTSMTLVSRLLERLLEWVIAGQQVEERSSPSQQTRWTRWLSDASGVLLFVVITWLAELLLCALYLCFQVWSVAIAFGSHAFLTLLMAFAMRLVNGYNLLPAPQTVLWFRRATMVQLVFVPGIVHGLLGGAARGTCYCSPS